jgi:hypothetical protein
MKCITVNKITKSKIERVNLCLNINFLSRNILLDERKIIVLILASV